MSRKALRLLLLIGLCITLVQGVVSAGEPTLYGSHNLTIEYVSDNIVRVALDEVITLDLDEIAFTLVLSEEIPSVYSPARTSADVSVTLQRALGMELTVGTRVFLDGEHRVYTIASYGW